MSDSTPDPAPAPEDERHTHPAMAAYGVHQRTHSLAARWQDLSAAERREWAEIAQAAIAAGGQDDLATPRPSPTGEPPPPPPP